MTDWAGSSPVSVLVSDLDRTLTLPDADLGEPAERAIEAAHRCGLKLVIASGRIRAFMEELWARHPTIDGMVAENGCVLLLGRPGQPPARLFDSGDLSVFRARLADARLPDVEFGDVIASFRREDVDRAKALRGALHVDLVPNVDRVMAVPAGVSKLNGTLSLIARMGIDPTAFAAIGDGENDYELLVNARVAGMPENAVPPLKEVPGYHARAGGPFGVLEFIGYLEGSGVVVPANGRD
jgi:hydroxymethylpyrimidine pyrophosphatase-like HAD family hydrolase